MDGDEAAEDALRQAMKAEIRQRRRSVRRAMPHDARVARSEAIAAKVTALPEWERARTVLAFVSMRSEVQTEGLVASARASGKRVAAPRLAPDRTNLELREWREGDELEESGMMFLQPARHAASIDDDAVDLVLVPALAADERGHRIGYGKGFYDRLLPRLSRAFRVCVIFDFELVQEVPERPGDEPVDVVVTDRRVLRTRRAATE
ncbi:MAG TPA: 5-formyltetrahydrofolate cyclo-ligase [Sandaracinaceae bacterium]